MNNFIISVSVSYLPLHEEAKKIAQEVGKIDVFMGKTPIAIEYLDNKIKTPQDIEKYLGLPILGVILNEKLVK
jgi:capsular polysaccharide biosynthesis protein